MSNLRACAVGMLALAACGGGSASVDAGVDEPPIDAKVWMDAPPTTYDFSCMGNSAPTAASAQVTLSGVVTKVSIGTSISIDPLSGAMVKACKAGAVNCMGGNQYGATATSSSTSGMEGEWSIGPFDSGSLPVPAYVEMTEGSSRTVYEYPPSDFIGDQANIPVLTFDSAAIGALQFFGCSQNDAANGMIGVAVVDCADMPITDSAYLTLSVKQGGADVAFDPIDLSTLPGASMAAGTWLLCNIPENAATTVGATYNGMALRSHDVKVIKGTTSATIIRPGY